MPNYREELSSDQNDILDKMLEQADSLQENTGVIFRRAPTNFVVGTPYITPDDLVDSGATTYSISQINRLASSGEIEVVRFDRKILLTPDSVDQLFDREARSEAGELDKVGNRRGGGRRPSSGEVRPSRRKNPWPIDNS